MTTAPRVFVPFFIGSLLLTLTFGATLGMINLARLTAGWGLGVLPRPSVWAHRFATTRRCQRRRVAGVTMKDGQRAEAEAGWQRQGTAGHGR